MTFSGYRCTFGSKYDRKFQTVLKESEREKGDFARSRECHCLTFSCMNVQRLYSAKAYSILYGMLLNTRLILTERRIAGNGPRIDERD